MLEAEKTATAVKGQYADELLGAIAVLHEVVRDQSLASEDRPGKRRAAGPLTRDGEACLFAQGETMRTTNRYKALPVPPTKNSPASQPIQVLCGPVLCRLQVWSESDWAALSTSRRPIQAEFAAGLGWVVALPELVMN